MTDRDALLRTILARPGDDLPRLVYADWLDEFGDCDRDAATAEWVRISCPGKTRKVMPAESYKWLAEHWRRLVPGLCDVHRATWGGDDPAGFRTGRSVRTFVRLPTGAAATLPTGESVRVSRAYSVRLFFSRGFLTAAYTWASTSARGLTPPLLADQPLAAVHGPRANDVAWGPLWDAALSLSPPAPRP